MSKFTSFVQLPLISPPLAERTFVKFTKGLHALTPKAIFQSSFHLLFSSIWHYRHVTLLEILSSHGIILPWFSSSLFACSFTASFATLSSCTQALYAGVFQASFLGLFLFLLYKPSLCRLSLADSFKSYPYNSDLKLLSPAWHLPWISHQAAFVTSPAGCLSGTSNLTYSKLNSQYPLLFHCFSLSKWDH